MGNQFSSVWVGTSTAIIFTTGCVIVCNSDEVYKLTFSLRTRRVWGPVARPHKWQLLGEHARLLGAAAPQLAEPDSRRGECAVTTGLLILLKAMGHGKDPLAEVCEIDTHNWDDHGRLRRKLDKTLKYLADRALMLRLVRCDDSFAQRACLNRELQDE